MNLNKINKLLDQIKTNDLMVAYHLEMQESLLNPKYKKYYEYGKKSVHEKTCMYNHVLKDFESAVFYYETGNCPTCEVLQDQYYRYYDGEINEDEVENLNSKE